MALSSVVLSMFLPAGNLDCPGGSIDRGHHHRIVNGLLVTRLGILPIIVTLARPSRFEGWPSFWSRGALSSLSRTPRLRTFRQRPPRCRTFSNRPHGNRVPCRSRRPEAHRFWAARLGRRWQRGSGSPGRRLRRLGGRRSLCSFGLLRGSCRDRRDRAAVSNRRRPDRPRHRARRHCRDSHGRNALGEARAALGGTILGCFVLGVVTSSMNMHLVPYAWTMVLKAFIVLAAATSHGRRQRHP